MTPAVQARAVVTRPTVAFRSWPTSANALVRPAAATAPIRQAVAHSRLWRQGGANPSLMTRAGQINAASGNNAADTGMPLNCQPASHG